MISVYDLFFKSSFRTSMWRIYLYIFGISSVCMKSIFSCSINVCLTWAADKNKITFKCKVSNLVWNVGFFNPEDKEQGYCTIPLPIQACHSSHNVITQDPKTNTTVLAIQRKVDNRLNGMWKCYHGTNMDKAVVNVTIITQETIKTIFKNNNCGEQHMAWTFIGVMIGVISVLILRTVFTIRQYNIQSCYSSEKWCGRCFMCSTQCHYVTTILTGIVLVIFFITVPLVSGLQKNVCKDKEYFTIYGVCMVFVFVICVCIPRKGEQIETPTECETTSNQQLLSEQNEPPNDCQITTN